MITTALSVAEVDRIMKGWDAEKKEVFALLVLTARRGGCTGDHAKIAMAEMGVSFDDWKEWNKQKKVEEETL